MLPNGTECALNSPKRIDAFAPSDETSTSRAAETRNNEAAGSHQENLPITVIERRPGWRFIDLSELWRYRELLGFLTWRDIKVRYKQTVLGAAWAIIQPLATMIVFSLFLGRMSGADMETYPLFVFAGLLPWTFFANGISAGGQSVVANQNLVTKVYFPRLLIPMGTVAAGLVDLAIALVLLLVMMLFFGAVPGWSLLLTPGIVALLAIAAMGVGTLLSALTVAYRDFRHAVPFMVQLWMFATPAIYLDGGFSPRWDAWLPLNPAHGLVAAFRQVVLNQPLDLYALSVSSAVSVSALLLGCLYFRRVERSFADII